MILFLTHRVELHAACLADVQLFFVFFNYLSGGLWLYGHLALRVIFQWLWVRSLNLALSWRLFLVAFGGLRSLLALWFFFNRDHCHDALRVLALRSCLVAFLAFFKVYIYSFLKLLKQCPSLLEFAAPLSQFRVLLLEMAEPLTQFLLLLVSLAASLFPPFYGLLTVTQFLLKKRNLFIFELCLFPEKVELNCCLAFACAANSTICVAFHLPRLCI